MATPVVAWLAEDLEEGLDPCDEWCTGLFYGHLEGDGLGGEGPRLEPSPLGVALAWAGEHAEVAIVRIADEGSFWAGARRPPARWGFAPLPAHAATLGRRRPPGLAWCDRPDTADPVGWPVEVTLTGAGAAAADAARRAGLTATRLAERLSAGPAVERARRATYRGGGAGGGLAVRAVVRAPSRAAAGALAERLTREALTDLVPRDRAAALDVATWVAPPELPAADGGPDGLVRRRWSFAV